MPGAMRKMAVYLGLVEDDTCAEDYDEFEEPERDSRRDKRSSRRGFKDGYDEEDDDRYAVRSVRPISEPRAVRTFRANSPVDRLPIGSGERPQSHRDHPPAFL